MFCNNCGSKINDGDKFCNNCGSQVESGFSDSYVNLSSNNNVGNNNNKFDLVSLIISIVAILLALFGRIYAIPLGVAGIVFGALYKKKSSKKIAGIVLGIISIVIIGIYVVIGILEIFTDSEVLNRLYNELDYSTSDNYVAGTWNCSNFDGSATVGEYTITMKLNKDNSFVFGEYGDLDSNHAGGTYTYEDEVDKNETVTNEYKYYIINLNGEMGNYVIDGVKQDRAFQGKFEMGITSVNAQKQAILMNYYTYQMYACFLEK